ncbi:MAG TPA: calcium/sodium antiporter [Candidatus Marinimicrobia bacterium]|jgi:cation:H+ antiporter|nr:calcium/sodium antiporter [Candidatus Neomarinimicrobiota bacterium]MDP7121300.1 calcium/sodium antiporter [Candidatus Neomarinimicrobiota bacterium]MDP7483973.1 calcium/sodium antiporter [Candidatus Neomarinimicrobiota bacterium]MDP7527824.1 calcium/sodium antiporter [Candidatus Neomarinimicrobiota bacterium]MDP7715540.1 calcium/sodium antiporter [Candidatus Neomarinimicrobiota bacterium]|tara:strand:+ start:3135 stop:4055 length:921 start_codon:yes stop_codon:yes gene_type:complete
MEILKDVTIVLVCVGVIAKGASWLVDSASKIAKRLGISELVIGLTILALGTSAPEFAVSILAALKGSGNIAIGNIVGSNIFNLGFILGGTAIVHSLQTSRIVIVRDGFFLLFGTFLLLFFLWDLTLTRFEGGVLFSLLILYLVYLYVKREPLEAEQEMGKMLWWDPLMLILGLVMVLIGAHFMVESAINLARYMGVSEWVIGATVIAAGTSAPEFATSLAAALRSRYGMSVGNLIGSDIFNLFGVLGVAGILNNIPVSLDARMHLVFLSLMVALVLVFMRTGWVVSRREGYILVMIGLVRWINSFI